MYLSLLEYMTLLASYIPSLLFINKITSRFRFWISCIFRIICSFVYYTLDFVIYFLFYIFSHDSCLLSVISKSDHTILFLSFWYPFSLPILTIIIIAGVGGKTIC